MKTKRITITSIAASILVAAALCHLTFAQQQPPVRRGPPRGRARLSQKRPETKKAEQKKKEPIVAIVGADVHTVSREVIRRGTVLVQGDKILDVGQDIKVPTGATIIDAAGKHVTPGFIAMSMSRVAVRSSRAMGI